MKHLKILSDLELENINGADTPWGDLPNYFKLGDSIGRWLAHRPDKPSSPPPFCYNYGSAYPAPVLPCH
ncbi:TPA: hypothetical protein ACGOYL_001152 [Streptococcus suis]|uniref:ComC/BlpC family peptide pheromone/bacteriocin n=1 Tax=Streptococcus parasuis TaxID=1501662 RepID=A0ABV2EVK9_9STRE|nr:hypothetical protein [Streptococcus parasuis]NQN92224.1 hypothetical protein [Streptococcus suis]NQP59816.1 hypothetical protein [Streptococcus suis]BCP59814.1 hypothetical protein SUT286_11400 [Streptococcus parasuis]HEM3178164.1 hypothetical protein [Streptococcus suis]